MAKTKEPKKVNPPLRGEALYLSLLEFPKGTRKDGGKQRTKAK